MLIRVFALSAFTMAISSSALALPEWRIVPNMTTANIAATKGARLEASAGLSWPDGRQTMVTFWLLGDLHLRCRTFFDAEMRQSGDICEQPQEAGN
jgi:hypothetical protein